jgi:ureidoglycolate hydrolase
MTANFNIRINASELHDIFVNGGYDKYHPFTEVAYYAEKIQRVWDITEAEAVALAEQIAVISTK